MKSRVQSHAAVTAEYPVEPMNILKFKDYGHTLEVPFTIYADFESILEEVDDDENKATRKINKHVPCGFRVLQHRRASRYNREEVVVYSGEIVCLNSSNIFTRNNWELTRFWTKLCPWKNWPRNRFTTTGNAKTCYNCGVEFSADQDDENRAKNRDHNHLDGQYIGPACSRCNLLRRYKQATRPKKNKPATYEIPIFFTTSAAMIAISSSNTFPPLTNKDMWIA